MTYNVVFLGTPEFSVDSLRVLNENNSFNIKLVVTMPDRPAGRGKKMKAPPVAIYAKKNNLPLLQTSNINKDEEFDRFINSNEIDFFLVIAFSQFLGKKILTAAKFGAFNIHTSLLPKYRGAAPIQYALLNGDKTTGVCIQRMVSKMDAGDICYEHSVEIKESYTSLELFQKLQQEASVGLNKFLNLFTLNSGILNYRVQNEDDVSFAPIIKKEDGLINPYCEDFNSLKNKFRAYFSWPGLFIYFNDFRLKIHEIEPYPQELQSGDIDISQGMLLLGLKDNSTVRLKKIQAEGKKIQTDSEFLNGIKNKVDNLTLDISHYE